VARRGRPVVELVLTEDESETLQRWARRAKSSQALAQRCRIVLGCAAGNTNKQVAEELGVSPQMVCKWRQRFVDKRLDGLTDEPRPGAPRKITDEAVEELIVATLERQPKDATHWSRASMAAQTGLSKSTVGRIWKSFGLKPHQVDTFKISNDPQFVDKVRDVVGLYLDPKVGVKAPAVRGFVVSIRAGQLGRGACPQLPLMVPEITGRGFPFTRSGCFGRPRADTAGPRDVQP
jgi:transposase